MSAAPDSEDIVCLDRGNNTTCSIHLYGATVLSWVYQGEEMLFVSSKSHFDKKKAIRGGIPVVFPNFGPWECGPQHGFARISMWNLEGKSMDADGNISARFTLVDNEESRKMWDYRFKLTYTITVKESELKCAFKVQNTGSDEFDFTCLLHTYLYVPDIHNAGITGLEGLSYTDKVAGAEKMEDRPLVTIEENVDSVYKNTPDEHQVTNVAGRNTLAILKNNFPDTVVWNPWKEKAAAMADFADDEYPSMLCVEAGYVSQRKNLAADEQFVASQTLSIVGLANL